jgi:hypothetical protein
MNEDFYIGYEERAPHGLGVWLRRIAIGLLAASALIAVTLVWAQHPFAESMFDYGQPRTFRGVVWMFPAPSLALENGRVALLVAPGKHGAADLVRSFDGQTVDLSGMKIERGGDLMIEVVPGTLQRMPAQASGQPEWQKLGGVTLRGEIVDSKCYLGVMNPGEGKVHRACAARCILGGVPPALVAADADGARRVIVLTGLSGAPIASRAAQYAGEPVVVKGLLFRSASQMRMEVDPSSIQPAVRE